MIAISIQRSPQHLRGQSAICRCVRVKTRPPAASARLTMATLPFGVVAARCRTGATPQAFETSATATECWDRGGLEWIKRT